MKILSLIKIIEGYHTYEKRLQNFKYPVRKGTSKKIQRKFNHFIQNVSEPQIPNMGGGNE